MPAELPSFAGLRFTYRFRPSTEVGGDALNVISLDNEHVAIYMLDVAGHGVAAALLSVTLTHMLSALPDRSFLYRSSGAAQAIASPAEVVSRLNTHFLSSPGAPPYFTMIYGLLYKTTGVFRYVAAGHLGPIHVAPGRAPSIKDLFTFLEGYHLPVFTAYILPHWCRVPERLKTPNSAAARRCANNDEHLPESDPCECRLTASR